MFVDAVILGALYHWSPIDRRPAIRAEGLRPYQPPTVCSDPTLALPYISLGPTPSCAWGYSGDMEWVSEIEAWDLWQVRLQDGDEVRIRAEFGPRIVEVKVHNTIPGDRVWWVATRSQPICEEVPPA